jgi:hypothetical protein
MHSDERFDHKHHPDVRRGSHYLARISESLLSRSCEQSQLQEAMREWRHTGFYKVFDDCDGTCELCGKDRLRFQFHIENLTTNHSLMIGSECIRKFKSLESAAAIVVIGEVDATKRRATREKNDQHVTTQLLIVACVDDQFDIEEFLTYWRDRGAFTPSQLATLAWRFEKAEVEFAAHCFRITIRRSRERAQLRSLEQWRLLKIWASLSSYQRRWCRRHRADGDELPSGQYLKG